jgi:hypothetical protein
MRSVNWSPRTNATERHLLADVRLLAGVTLVVSPMCRYTGDLPAWTGSSKHGMRPTSSHDHLAGGEASAAGCLLSMTRMR